jgi:hypothetical protein
MAKVWVSMTDKFFSGWGPAEGKTNKYIVECENYEQAEAVKKAAEDRPEMKYINICINKPHYGSHVVESHTKFADLHGPWKTYWREVEA